MKISKQQLQDIVKSILFLTILCISYMGCSYLFRDTTESPARPNILDYYEEEENTLDVVFVGASNILRYWNPMEAWNNYGFTSRNYSVNEMQAASYLYSLIDALKTQSPELVVVEGRAFTRGISDEVSPGARRLYDAWDFGLDRVKAVTYYCQKSGIFWPEALTLHLDLIYNHSKYEALIEKRSWELADNRLGDFVLGNICKGYCWSPIHTHYEDPSANLNDQRGEIPPKTLDLCQELIDYCRENNIQLMFVATPMVITAEESSLLNSLSDYLQEQDVPFLNTNLCYDEMNVVFSEDFYNSHHMNALGADKFTNYFAAYLDEHYNLPDRRNEPEYELWHTAYETSLESINKTKKNLRDIVAKKAEAVTFAEQIKTEDDVLAWMSMAENSAFTTFIVSYKGATNNPSKESMFLMRNFGIQESYFDKNFMVVYQNQKVVFAKVNGRTQKGTVGTKKLEYSLGVSRDKQLVIDGVDYLQNLTDGIHFVVFDNNSNQVIDQVMFTVEQDGYLRMSRIPVEPRISTENALEQMKNTNDPSIWIPLAKNAAFSSLIVSYKEQAYLPSETSMLLLKEFGIQEDFCESNFMVVYQNQEVKFSKAKGRTHEGTVGTGKVKFSLGVSRDKTLTVDGVDYLENLTDGIHVVVFNNNTNKVIDQVMFIVQQDGSLKMEHIPVNFNP